ncbi:MAG TPA: S9 family peptidase [Acidimicrobiales bacterium]|nr:S9 family peptidase [Acidimicrobiales bacterium]
MATTAAYGSWRSPITGALLVEDVISPNFIVTDSHDIYWIERRPSEQGRQAIVVMHEDGSIEDLLPPLYNARTRAHEYGGLCYCVDRGRVFFSNFADQRIYCRERSGAIAPLAATGETDCTTRYADFIVTRDGASLISVRERHWVNGVAGAPGVVNDLVRIPTEGEGPIEVLATGNDFYSAPRVAPDGKKLAYLTWNHPNMPWDGTELYRVDLDPDNRLGPKVLVAGGVKESISQPRFRQDGGLLYLSDRSGFWNLYDETGTSLLPIEADCAGPDWQFGQSSYALFDDDRIVITFERDAAMQLAIIDHSSTRDLHHPLSYFASLNVDARGRIVALAGSAGDPLAVVAIDPANNDTSVLRKSRKMNIDPGYISTPRHFIFPTTGGLEAHALFYPPKNRDFQGSPGERPPLIVQIHGGPTAGTRQLFDPEIQYWTSRGFAVVDVDYGGSSGYGRAYRERLEGQLGIVDVDDCTNAALALAERGRVDRRRLIIHGGSAGGYTTLACMTFRDVFAVGASYFGISDLSALARDTHKFESRYLDRLVGPYPEDEAIFAERSPLFHARELKCPVIFFQGLEDAIVPPVQAEEMVEALHTHGVPAAYIAYEGEQHGFRKQASIIRSVEAELYFYGRVLDIDIADDIEPVEIRDASLLIH